MVETSQPCEGKSCGQRDGSTSERERLGVMVTTVNFTLGEMGATGSCKHSDKV